MVYIPENKLIKPGEQESVRFRANQNLENTLDLDNFLKGYNEIKDTIVDVREMRDDTEYPLVDICLKMIEIAKKNGYKDIEFCDKKVDSGGKVISIAITARSTKYPDHLNRLTFLRNCSY